MSIEPIQNPLFDDPLGITLKNTRLRKDMSIESVARQMRLPVAVIDAMEREAWQKLGAPIYVKSYLSSYLKLLELPESLATTLGSQRAEANLVTMAAVSNVQRTLHRSWRRIIYMVMTGVLVGSVAMLALHLQSRSPSSETATVLAAPIDLAATAVADATAAPPAMDVDTTAIDLVPAGTAQLPQPETIAASLSPLPATSNPADLVLYFRGESWVDIVDSSGRSIERGMVAIGAERRYAPGSVSRLTLGNASMIDVLQSGQSIDLGPYLSEDVARFGLSSDGRITAPGG